MIQIADGQSWVLWHHHIAGIAVTPNGELEVLSCANPPIRLTGPTAWQIAERLAPSVASST